MSPRGTDRLAPHRKEFWERWPTRIAVLCAALALFGVGMYSQSYASPDDASWHARTSSLLREIGFASPRDARP